MDLLEKLEKRVDQIPFAPLSTINLELIVKFTVKVPIVHFVD